MNIWQNKRTILEIGVLASITTGAMAIRRCTMKEIDLSIFEKYPNIRHSQFVTPLLRFHKLDQPVEFELLLQTINQFLMYTNNHTHEGEQFLANRYGELIRTRCLHMIEQAKHHRDINVVDHAINIEQDEYVIFDNLIENFLRNMLLCE